MAGAVVFATSAEVLILEILAARLLAPYVGVTLETYSAIIGTVLAGIAAGSWAGGRAADRTDPRRLLGPLLVGGGALALATVPVVRFVGDTGDGASAQQTILLAAVGFFLPAAVLSAVTPTVAKLRLQSLATTGRTVGSLSALGTAGALFGTFFAGFFLVEALPTSTSILAVGGALVAGGLALWLWTARLELPLAAVLVATAVAGAVGTVATAGECDVETTYHCARIEADGDTGRLLRLDTLRHSYVDLADPEHLQFRYIRLFAEVADALSDGPVEALHIGGGGFTMPRYLASTRPGTASTVLEIDGGLVELDRDRLGLDEVPGVDVRIGDGRILIGGVADRSQDLVLGDAFGGLAVPWHLTTLEAVREVRRVLRRDGVYVVNVIDAPPTRFAKAEAATLLEVFEEVAVLAPRPSLDGETGDNFVLVASMRPLGLAPSEDGEVLDGEALRAWIGDAPVLRDDHAPVDQWLASSR